MLYLRVGAPGENSALTEILTLTEILALTEILTRRNARRHPGERNLSGLLTGTHEIL